MGAPLRTAGRQHQCRRLRGDHLQLSLQQPRSAESAVVSRIFRICGTARQARAFFRRFITGNGAVICPAFLARLTPLASMKSAMRGADHIGAL
jgi:hypothetical protein